MPNAMKEMLAQLEQSLSTLNSVRGQLQAMHAENAAKLPDEVRADMDQLMQSALTGKLDQNLVEKLQKQAENLK